MNYFYIIITKKENIERLDDTINLIKKYCLKDSNKYSVNINKSMHSNCILDNENSFINVYHSEDNNYEDFESKYIKKYNISKLDVEMLLKVYGYINIEKIEEMKVQVKIYYSFNFINALQLIIDLLGENESLNQIMGNPNVSTFNQVVNNESESETIIIENNNMYNALCKNGSIIKSNIIEKNDILKKYLQYKILQNKFKQKQMKELRKI